MHVCSMLWHAPIAFGTDLQVWCISDVCDVGVGLVVHPCAASWCIFLQCLQITGVHVRLSGWHWLCSFYQKWGLFSVM